MQNPIDIGTNRQIFLDELLIDTVCGARRIMHSPTRRETVLVGDKPWDEASVAFMSMIRDGDLYKGYYRCDHLDSDKAPNPRHTAYAESSDGIHWRKPSLGLIEFQGSKDNNLVWMGPGANLCVFIDKNPAEPPDRRYKAVVRTGRAEAESLGAPGPCVLALSSPDGVNWGLMQDAPILTDDPFDSYNVAFWDEWTSQYVIYTRGVGGTDGPFKGGVRWIRRATSDDFLNWSGLELIDTGEVPSEHLYTNACVPYERSPGTYLMFPSRLVLEHTPDPDWPNGPGVNDIALMSSRDGITWDRSFMEAFIRPGLDMENWHERGIYFERGISQTSEDTLSMYCSDHWRYPTTRISRYTLRTDGFVSVNAGYRGGEFTTQPLIFSGRELELNYSTSAVGSIKVEIQDTDGSVIPGFGLDDFPEKYGDEIDGNVSWNGGGDVSALAGKPVRLRFALKDADIYAFKFG
ncbi:MAG: hypothetical protein OXD46_02630 [Chloroflexi bacterium]|nr:hypothetical protein [Chloroflexota bacterium]